MNPSPLVSRLISTGVLAAFLAGCAGVSSKPDPQVQELRRGPGNTPQRNVTDFSQALRCMDETLYTYGTRDIVVMLEELQDNTHRLGVGTRDMMISAVSDMTRRSRAIRLVTFGQDSFNIVNLMQQLEKRTPFGVLPQYDIRGSVTQFDEDVVKREGSIGINFQQLAGLRAGGTTQFNVLGFDASVVTVPDLVLIPGVTSKNTIIVPRDERSVNDGRAVLQKVGLGIDFNFAVSRNAGTAQALRNMVELASIELVGKLTRVPYWGCLGLDTSQAEVKREIDDWYFSMRNESDRIKFFQEHLRFRKFFDGPLDGKPSEAFNSAVVAYKEGLGIGKTTPNDERFFAEFLMRAVPPAPNEPFTVPAQLATASSNPTGSAQAAGSPQAAAQPEAKVTVAALRPFYKVKEEIEIAVQSERAGYVYCYVQASGGAIQRIYPNRTVKDPRIEAGEVLMLPGGRDFKITSDKPGTQSVACMIAPREVYNDLPPPLRWGDFEDVRLKTFAEIKTAFETSGKAPVVMFETKVEVRG